MKSILTALLLGLFASTLNAKTVDQEGRTWITATDIEVVEDEKLSKVLKSYVFLYNDIMFCYFPEIFSLKDGQLNQYLSKMEQEEPSRFSLYTRIFYRLPYARLPESFLDRKQGDILHLHDEFSIEPLDKIYGKYQTHTNIKHKKQCKKIGEFIHQNLLKNY